MLKPGAKGTIQSPRRVPFAMQEKLKQTLAKLTEQKIIADVDKPTEWVNSLVVTGKKSGGLRLCLDPKPLNKVVMREPSIIPTASEVQAQLAGKRIFTVLDMRDAYWHVNTNGYIFVPLHVQYTMGSKTISENAVRVMLC